MRVLVDLQCLLIIALCMYICRRYIVFEGYQLLPIFSATNNYFKNLIFSFIASIRINKLCLQYIHKHKDLYYIRIYKLCTRMYIICRFRKC
jgi:hypothetical protein